MRTAGYLGNKDADLLAMDGEDCEARFLDTPEAGKTLVVSHRPDEHPWLMVSTTDSQEDLEKRVLVRLKDDWEVAQISPNRNRWFPQRR